MMDLSALNATLLDFRLKGFPGESEPLRLDETADRHWNVLREDLPLPLAVLKESALKQNSRWMSEFLRLSGADIAPHGKTTMAPQLFQRQLADGAWGISLATVSQVQVARHYGVHRILLADQLVGRRAIHYVARELAEDPDFDFFCLVDSVESVRLLVEVLEKRPVGRPLQVLLEGGVPGGRTGCRTLASGLEVAREVQRASPHLVLRGVEGFEGMIGGETPELRESAVSAFVGSLAKLAEACEEAGLFGDGELILTTGGSAYYDLVIRHLTPDRFRGDVRVVTRSGCYLTHDSGMYKREFALLLERIPEARHIGDGLRPALEVWGYVQSRPEPGLCIVNVGKRDISHDIELPTPEHWYRPGTAGAPHPLDDGSRVTRLNDQHAYLVTPPDGPLRVGDMVAFGVSHPCTTFDRWQTISVVNDVYDVVDTIRTFF